MTRIARWWFAPAPAERLAALRIAIGGYAVVWMIAQLSELVAASRSPASQFAAVGVVRLLRAPLPPGAVVAIAAGTLGLLIAFTAGIGYRITAPLAALGQLWTLSYRNSWGMVFHTENLLVLHVIALACAPAADAWTLGARRGSRLRVPDAGYGWAIKLLAALTCATYLLAGIAKLRLAGVDWLGGEQLRHQIAIDNLRKALLGGATAPLAGLLIAHPGGLVALSVVTLATELGAPLALLDRRVARIWSGAAWGFHVGVVLAMNVWFPYALGGIAFLPLIEAERAMGWPLRWWRRRAIPRS
jgi:hypothetical protein